MAGRQAVKRSWDSMDRTKARSGASNTDDGQDLSRGGCKNWAEKLVGQALAEPVIW